MDQQLTTLETDVPLSQSVIWRLQREFWAGRGLQAWTQDLVPNFITNNPFIAENYARVVAAFIADCSQHGLHSGIPIRILELGAGPGKFSYLFLRHLQPLLGAQGFAPEAIRYYMTDCSQSLLESWRANSYLAEFVNKGILKFELFDLSNEIQFTQRRHPEASSRSGEAEGPCVSLPPKQPRHLLELDGSGPLVVIANYVFDSLPQDALVIQDGQIFELLVTTQWTPQAVGDKPELSRLQLSFKNIPLNAGRFAEPLWDQILKQYRTRLQSATVLFPAHALHSLRALSRFTDGRMLLLAADKGFAHEDALLLSPNPPALEFHASNCFSMMVNFDAIAKFFCLQGGQALLPDKHFSNLNLCAFLQGPAGCAFPQTQAAYEREQAAFGVDDLFTLLAWLNAHMEEMSVPQILAALRLTRWDPIAFMRLFPVLARQLRSVVAERNDLRAAVMRTWANHYPIAPNENELAFQCGVVLLELRFFADAIGMFQTSQRIFAPSAATSYNLGLCFQGLGRTAEALACMQKACDLDPKFEPARLSLKKLEQESLQNSTISPF